MRTRGFSLVEIVIALGILSFILIPLVALMSNGLKTARESHCDTVAATIALQTVNRLKATEYATLSSEQFNYNYEGQQTNAASAYYKCQTEITSPQVVVSDASFRALTNHVKRIRIVVTWPILAGTQQPPYRQIFETQIAEY